MITVINNFNENVEMYEGMSLADASAQFMIESNQLVNDFMMDLLMTEHQYLYDHGEQIDWTQEAADGGLSFMDKIGNLVNNAKNLFLKIVNNIIAFVQEKTAQVINWFRKIGLNKSNIRTAFEKNPDEKVDLPKCISKYNEFLSSVETGYTSAFANAENAIAKNGADKMITSAGEFINDFDPYFETDPVTAKQVPVDILIDIIFKSDKITKSAKKAYKKATDSLENAKKKFASKKNRDADDIKDDLEAFRAGILNNTYVMRDLVKIYGALVREAITLAKELVKTQKGKDKDAKKDKENKAKPQKGQSNNTTRGKFNADTGTDPGKAGDPTSDDYSENIDNLRDSGMVNASYIEEDEMNDLLIEACEYILGIDNYDETFNEAADYVVGCINGDYEADSELLEACAEYILEAKSDLEKDIRSRARAEKKAERLENRADKKAERLLIRGEKAAARHDKREGKLNEKQNALLAKLNAAASDKEKDRIHKALDRLEKKYARNDNRLDRANERISNAGERFADRMLKRYSKLDLGDND